MEALSKDLVTKIEALTITDRHKRALTDSLQSNKMDQLLRRLLSSKVTFGLAEATCSQLLEIAPQKCISWIENENKDGHSALKLLVDGGSNFLKKYFQSKDGTNLGINAGMSLFDDSVRHLIAYCFKTYCLPVIMADGRLDRVNKGRYMLELGAGDGRFYRLLTGDPILKKTCTSTACCGA